jgi:Uma2 family endonuclease
MVAEPRERRRMSVEEWRTLERESRDVKHEYIDGYAYAMAGGTETPARIAINAVAALDAALSDGPCMVYASDMPVRLSESRYTYPDVTVSCEGAGITSRERTELAAPRVVFEVLSPSTERYDRTHKTAYYRGCASLHEYVLVNTEVQLVEVYRRTNEGWGLFRMHGPRDEVELTSVDVRFPVSVLYRRTDVPETSPA